MASKKYDHMSIARESGVTLQTESASVTFENPLGKKRTGIVTTSGPHTKSVQRTIPRIKGKTILTTGQDIKDFDFDGERITLRCTESGKRVICHDCCTEDLGELGKDNPEISILVLGGYQEL